MFDSVTSKPWYIVQTYGGIGEGRGGVLSGGNGRGGGRGGVLLGGMGYWREGVLREGSEMVH